MTTVSTARTRLERKFEPEAVRELKAGATRDIAVGATSRDEDDLESSLSAAPR